MKKVEIFLSYCWADDKLADDIEVCLSKNLNINLHRDKLDIGNGESIKKYMQSISQMDYTILLISDAYLKSANCMYEVLEVMRDRMYQDKIFPAVIHNGIYKPAIRASYVKYWQQEYSELKQEIEGIDPQNIGKLGTDLKHRQDISSNVADFLDLVADMNNPAISDVCIAIEKKLEEKKLINAHDSVSKGYKPSVNLFSAMGIPGNAGRTEPSDYEINQFMSQSFENLNGIMSAMCRQLEEQYPVYQVTVERIDLRNCLYQFYKNGQLLRSLKLFLDSSFGAMNIGLSNDSYSMGGNHSWNAMYTAKNTDGRLGLSATLSISGNREQMTVEEVVKDIWTAHINPWLR